MSKYRVLFNPLSDNNGGEAAARELENRLTCDTLTFTDIREIENYKKFFEELPEDEFPVICGGDGTLNRFVNDLWRDGTAPDRDVYYFACGSGNDFMKDIGGKKGDLPVVINKYLENLPYAEINGKAYRFINGIGYGIDGYCCEEADRQKAKDPQKKINYTAIAIKGILGAYSSRNAKITVDGKEYNMKHVWLTPMMNGRYFGGGMMATPSQDRLNKERTITLMAFCGLSRIITLAKFPKIFSGEHVKFKTVHMLSGYDITVEYDRPTSLQVDGETILGVTRCRCTSCRTYEAEHKAD